LRLPETRPPFHSILSVCAKDFAGFRFEAAVFRFEAAALHFDDLKNFSPWSSSEIGSSGLFFLSDRSHGIPLSVTAEGKESVVEECWPAAKQWVKDVEPLQFSGTIRYHTDPPNGES